VSIVRSCVCAFLSVLADNSLCEGDSEVSKAALFTQGGFLFGAARFFATGIAITLAIAVPISAKTLISGT
jgi:hypothetical protein